MKRLFFFLLLLTATPIFGAEPEKAAPPQASFTITQCGRIVVVWIIMPNGKVARMDKDRHPDTDAQQKAFIEWLETGPRDIYDLPCGTSA